MPFTMKRLSDTAGSGQGLFRASGCQFIDASEVPGSPVPAVYRRQSRSVAKHFDRYKTGVLDLIRFITSLLLTALLVRLIEKINKLEPSLKALIFCLYPLGYYLFDILNYSQAGKAVVLGFFTLATLYYWREMLPKRGYITVLLSFALVLISANIAFQASVRDIFGIQQDDTVVIQSIFSTTTNEATEFFIQYARLILVHVVILLAFCTVYWVLFIRDRKTAAAASRPKRKIRSLVVTGLTTFLLVAIHFNPALRRANPLYYFPYFYLVWQQDLEDARHAQELLAASASDESLNSMHLAVAAGARTVAIRARPTLNWKNTGTSCWFSGT